MAGIDDIRNKFIIDKKETDEVKNAEDETLEISKLVSFRKQQPFSMYDENKKKEMMESIKEHGVFFPIIVRKIENDKYEIISGHNRVECSKELGLTKIPAKIIECDDDKATIIMIDTNLCSRNKILPVEKGYAYKLKYETLKNQGKISSIKELEDLSQDGIEDNHTQIHRLMRLTKLTKELQIKVNNGTIPVNAGVELSYLDKEKQGIVNTVLEQEQMKITVIQSQKIRNINDFTYDAILKILKNIKEKKMKFTGKLEKRAIKMYKDKFNSDKEFTDLIIELLNDYFEATADS